MASPSASAIAGALSATTATMRSVADTRGGTSPLVAGYQQWVGGFGVPAGLPRPITDFLTGAFGPLTPIAPMPIDQPDQDSGRALPRRWEYPVGWNLPTGTPGNEGFKLTGFPTLRSLADRYSVVRAMLDIRINEMAGLEWDVGPTGEAQKRTKGDKNAAKDQSDRASSIVRWFKQIDSNYKGFQSWFTAACEDQHVIDALSLHILPPRLKGRGLFGSDLAEVELLAGETIRPLLDLRGSRPRPPAPAFQQYLWGVPRADLMDVITNADLDEMEARLTEAGVKDDLEPDEEYRADQLLYLPRWQRTWTPYGFSSIEKAILPIMIGVNRQGFLLDYFNEGSIPGVYVIAGEQYVTPAQQRQLQDSLNALAGDIAWKHRVIVLPPGSKTDPQKDLAWQAQVDQTIVEQVAMILHIQMQEISMLPGGRSTGLGGKGMAEAQQESVAETRTRPDRKWWKETFFDWVIQRVFKQDDLEWKWLDFEEQEDEAQKADSQTKYISIGKTTIDQERIEDGMDPYNLPLTKTPFILAGNQIIPLDPSVPPPAPPPPQVPVDPTTGRPAPPAPALPPEFGAKPDPFGPKPGRDGKNGKKPGKNGPKPDAGTPTPPDATVSARPAAPPSAPDGPPHPSFPFAAGTKPGKNGKVKPGKNGKTPKITVADLVKAKVRYTGNLTDIVYRYLLRSYPKDVVGWVKDGDWEFEPKVDLSDINMARRPGGRNPDKVSSIADTLDEGASMDPIVLVRRDPPDGYDYDIADGWHRTLAAEQAGWKELPAFVGTGFDDKADWGLEMQDESDSVKKVALSELGVLRRFLRKGGLVGNFRTGAIDSDVMRLLEADVATMHRDEALKLARERIVKAPGNPDALREWYNDGADGQIDWGSPGDFDACVSVASNYMADDDARGFCNLRHQDAVGGPPGSEDKSISLGSPLSTGLVPYDLAGQAPATCPKCGAKLSDEGTCPIHGVALKYSEDELRDDHGQWTAGGDAGATTGTAVDLTAQSPSDAATGAIAALGMGKAVNIRGDQVSALMNAGLTYQGPPLLMENVKVAGTRQFGQDGLGIPRDQMPQVPLDRRDAYFAYLKGQGIGVSLESVDPHTLQPAQNGINLARTATMWRVMSSPNPPDTRILFSRDNYVIDGDHRWAAAVALRFGDPSYRLAGYRVDANFRDVLRLSNQWDTAVGVPHLNLVAAIDAELARRGVSAIDKGASLHGWEHVAEGRTTRRAKRPPDMGPGIAGVERDGKRYGVGVGRDDEGVFVMTHRARSRSYPNLDAIPTTALEYIDSTG